MKAYTKIGLLILFFCHYSRAEGQQMVDTSFKGYVQNPYYHFEKGPVILLDKAHNNGGQSDSVFYSLSKGLVNDGYKINLLHNAITMKQLKGVHVLAIIDALSKVNINHWELPTPSAFSHHEIKVIKKWVANGGSLFLVADHMPFAGASSDLAQAFDIKFINGFAIDTVEWDINKFKREDNTLREHPVTNGNNNKERIDEVNSYFGQCFTTSRAGLVPLMVFQNKNVVSYQPQKAWRFNTNTTLFSAKGWFQGLAGNYHKGRLVVLGDSGMISAHLIGKKARPVGINSPDSKDNFQFALNIFHWLSHSLN